MENKDIKFYTLKEAAHELQVSQNTIRRLLAKHNISVFRFGRQIRIPAEEFQRYVSDSMIQDASYNS